MLNLCLIPKRKIVSINTKNILLRTKSRSAWEIVHWSEKNIEFLFNYSSKLINSNVNSEISVCNATDSAVRVKYVGSVYEGLLILWNIAAILSESLSYYLLNDSNARAVYEERLSKITQIFYSLQTEYLPSVTIDPKSDLTVKLCFFYYTVYSAHYYECLLLKNKTTTWFLIASNLFNSAEKLNSFFGISFPFILNSIKYHILGLIAHSKNEQANLAIGSAIYYLKKAKKEFDDSPKDFQNQNSEIDIEIKELLSSLENDNKKIYFLPVKSDAPLPEIENLAEVLQTRINLEVIANHNNKKELERIYSLIKEARKNLINCSDSISTLTTLVFECDNSRKQINSSLFQNKNPDSKTITNLQNIEQNINLVFQWISTAKLSFPSLFDFDETYKKMNQIEEKLNQDIGEYITFFDHSEIEPFLDSALAELKLVEIPKSVVDEIAQQIEKCFEIMEMVSKL